MEILDVILYMSPKVIGIFWKHIDEKENVDVTFFCLGGAIFVPFSKDGSIKKGPAGVPV